MISIFKSKSGNFDSLQGISLTVCDIRPPTYLLWSHLKMLKLLIGNCLPGKVSSSLNLEIRNIMKYQ